MDEDEPLSELISLRRRAAVLSGAATGIGLASARRFAEAGASVIVADLNAERAEAAAAELEGLGDTPVIGVGVDVSDEASVEQLAATARDRLGGLDIWANFAAVARHELEEFIDFLEFPLEEWNREVAVNLTGAFLCSRAASRQMVETGRGGVIINTSTTMVSRYPGHRGMVAYAASKGGLEQLTMMLAAELGPRGIRVLALQPTVIETPGMKVHMETVAELMGSDQAFGELREMMPLRRFGNADDVARVALFAASEQSAFITGCVLPADGGELVI
jgi:NAD(P)-dependent dehydrogenase (short-subunit alcohol dehydrogenase family)